MISTVFLFLTVGVVSALAGNHSLFFIYTLLSKQLDQPGIHSFTALSILNGEVFKPYNSTSQSDVAILKYWNKVLDKEHDLRNVIKDCIGHDKSEELHVLQWRRGCVIEDKDGKRTFLEGVDEYGCDGTDFLSFTETSSSWVASVPAAKKTKMKFDKHIQETKSFITKDCKELLITLTKSAKEGLNTLPEVKLFTVFRLPNDTSNLTLTCMATGFYPKDMQIQVRKSKTSLPEHLLTSSGIRPNNDDTYQLRMSVNITEDEGELFDCYVTHSTLTKPIIVEAEKDKPVTPSSDYIKVISGVIGALLVLVVVMGILYCLKQRGHIAWLPICSTLMNMFRKVIRAEDNKDVQELSTMPAKDENPESTPMLDKKD